MTELDNVLAQNATEKQIEQALDAVCNVLPASVKDVCDAFVGQYTPQLIQLLLNYKPQQVCTLLGLCTSKAKAPVPVKDGQLCTICELAMTELDNILAQNATEQQIAQALDAVCNVLPASVKDVCDAFVAQYTPQLIQLLLNFKPQQICTLLGLCTAKTKAVPAPVKGGPQCAICEFVMTELDNVLAQNATEQQIEQALDAVCNVLPASVKDVCDAFVAQYTPQLIQLLLNYKPQQVCTLLGLCTAKAKAPVPVKDGQLCTICELAMTELDNILAQNATEQQIEQALDAVCNVLPASVKDVCDAFVAQYTPQLIQLLLNYKPQQVCTLLGLCTSNKVKDNSVECVICNLVMTQLEKVLGSKATQAEIESALDKVCTLLPEPYQDNCRGFISDFTPGIIETLLEETPSQVCALLKVCSSSAKAQLNAPHSGSDLCDFCKYVIQYIDNVLGDNATEADIEKVVNEICSAIPSNMKNECDVLMKDVAQIFIDLLVEGLSPQDLCTSAGLCNDHSHKIKAPSRKEPINTAAKAGEFCEICELVAQELEKMLAANSTEMAIEQALNKVCTTLPSSWTDACEELVAQYTPEIIDALLGFTPKELCATLKLCTDAPAPLLASKKEEVKASEAECVLCELVVQYLDAYIKANSTQAEIESALDKVCQVLPGGLAADCDKFVASYAPQIIALLLQETRPRQVCIMIGICSSGKQQQAVPEQQPKSLLFVPEVPKAKTVPAPVSNHPYCSSCKFLAYYLQTSMRDIFWENTARSSLYELCNQMSIEQGVCKLLMDMNSNHLLGTAFGFRFPMQFCQDTGLCEAPLAGTQRVTGKQETVQEVKNEQASLATIPHKPNQHCGSCKDLLSKLTTAVAEPFWQNQTQVSLDQMCKWMSYGEGVCQRLVANNMDVLVTKISDANWAPQTCQAINLCTEEEKEEVSPTQVACDLCERMTETARVFLQTGTSMDRVQTYLEMACRTATDVAEREQCLTMAKQYFPLMSQSLGSRDSSTKVCQMVKVCPVH